VGRTYRARVRRRARRRGPADAGLGGGRRRQVDAARPMGLTSHDGDVAWLTLDRGDNSPTIFWTYVVSALRTVRPGFGEQVLRRLQAPGIVIEDDVLPLIVDATSGLAGVALVLDDYHAINDEDVHEGLRYLIERLPAGVRVVIGTQVDPPLGLDRLRAQGDLHELRDLSLSADQTAALLRAVLGVEPEEAAVRGLHEWTALPRRDLDPRPLLRPALRGRHPARRRRAAARGAGARQRLPRHPRREHALVPVPPGLPRRARQRARRPSGPPTATGRTAFSATSRSTAGRSTRRSSLRGRHSTRRGNTTSRSIRRRLSHMDRWAPPCSRTAISTAPRSTSRTRRAHPPRRRGLRHRLHAAAARAPAPPPRRPRPRARSVDLSAFGARGRRAAP
jgi:hypothetical protein